MKPTDVFTALKLMTKIKRPVMLHGSPGVGKSAVVQQLAKEQNKKLFDVRLGTLDPTDLRGIPYFDTKLNIAKWGAPSILPSPDEEPSILFLDELNAAPPSVQAAAYQLILDRRIGDYILPDNCDIIAAGNLESDKGVVHAMPTPLPNRFTHIDFDVNVDDWISWAMANRVHSDVIGYISYNKKMLHQFDPNTLNERGFPTPRSWDFSGQILSEFDSQQLTTKQNKDQAKEAKKMIKRLFEGTMGSGATIEFFAHRDVAMRLPKAMDVLEGHISELPADIKDELSAHYSMIISLIYEIEDRAEVDSEDKLVRYVSNFTNFLDKNLSPEFCIYAMSKSLHSKIPPACFASKSVGEFTSKYGKNL